MEQGNKVGDTHELVDVLLVKEQCAVESNDTANECPGAECSGTQTRSLGRLALVDPAGEFKTRNVGLDRVKHRDNGDEEQPLGQIARWH